MPRALARRSDFGATELCRLARRRKDAAQAGRLLALAAIYDGGMCSEATLLGNVTLQIACDWLLRFNARVPRRDPTTLRTPASAANPPTKARGEFRGLVWRRRSEPDGGPCFRPRSAVYALSSPGV